MSLPKSAEAREYYRSSKQRLEDARILLKARRTTGAIYLAGYSVECILKALILDFAPEADRIRARESFRGAKAHRFDWLRDRYIEYEGPPFPESVSTSFLLVDMWTTNLRYAPGKSRVDDAMTFLRAARVIIRWADWSFRDADLRPRGER